ncbi:MAG TPA: hydantoinase/oxoprolinase family protein [Gammaproteobacteria bacterium]|nr:hydantoinase/oxoprolinase family protein [Gammaproteobacteria bacterium]
MNGVLLGVDTGGTFTDFVLCTAGRLHTHKVLSTPEAPERAILAGLAELGVPRAGLRLVHGSTVATNAVLEGKGARTAYIANAGLGDVLTIGRQARAALYDLTPEPPPAPVPRELCLEIACRLDASGRELEPLTADALRALVTRVRALAPEAVAVNLLFSFLDPTHERRIAAALGDGIFVSLSSEVLPEQREYERGIATWLNACVGPRVAGYLERLAAGVEDAQVRVMQSSGGTVAAADAARRGVHLLLSGPAGGLAGARFVAARAGYTRLLTFDMGGTSTDVALIDGDIRLTTEGRIGRFPVAVPMVDMHTIGAGGGSLAHVDAGGLLRVGPQSAGARPGPACYGRGGTAPTVTDAHVVLGRLPASALLGGRLHLDVQAARAAFAPLAARLGMSIEQAAAGVIRVVDENMVAALRVISVERGHDPRQYALLPFGGAGGLHVCALAEALGMTHALMPAHAGVLSALGMIVARPARELSQGVLAALEDLEHGTVEAIFAALEARGREELAAEGCDPAALEVRRSVDLRYRGQSYTLTLPWEGLAHARPAFDAAHAQRYGHALVFPVELVNVRVGVYGPPPAIELPRVPGRPRAAPRETVSVHGCASPVPVWVRAQLGCGTTLAGPAIVLDEHATLWLAPGWRATVDAYGNLALRRA